MLKIASRLGEDLRPTNTPTALRACDTTSALGGAQAAIADFVAAFGGSHRHVIDYLADEVLAQQPAETPDESPDDDGE